MNSEFTFDATPSLTLEPELEPIVEAAPQEEVQIQEPRMAQPVLLCFLFPKRSLSPSPGTSRISRKCSTPIPLRLTRTGPMW